MVILIILFENIIVSYSDICEWFKLPLVSIINNPEYKLYIIIYVEIILIKKLNLH